MLARFLPVAALFAALLQASAFADPLTFEQALQLASERSQAVRAARAGALSAAEAARAQGQLPDPMLSVGLDNLPVSGAQRFRTASESMTMKRVGISQEWVTPEKRALRQAAAAAQVGREDAAGQASLAEVRLQTALAFLDAYYAAQMLKLTRLTERREGAVDVTGTRRRG